MKTTNETENDQGLGIAKPLRSSRNPKPLAAREREVYNRLREWVCRAKSNTYAIRIARALNQYQPDERGQ